MDHARLRYCLGAFTTSGIMAVLGCSTVLGVEEKPCGVCADDSALLVCEGDEVRTQSCPTDPDPCARPVCREGRCELAPAVGAACGALGTGTCTSQGICVGPNTRLSALEKHSCAVLEDRSVWCWGSNDFGQLGDGTREYRSTPVRVRDLLPAVTVGQGYAHTCAIVENGRIYCWGNNQAGQTGSAASELPSLSPVQVPLDGIRFSAVGGGLAHTCALSDDGGVYCWGYNHEGQCGVDPSSGVILVEPTPKPVISNVLEVKSNKAHNCAVVAAAQDNLWCWGRNAWGQIAKDFTVEGNASFHDPQRVTLPSVGSTAISVALSWESTFAVTTTGAAFAWGYNHRGQLGTGSEETFEVEPAPIQFMSAIPDAAPAPITKDMISVHASEGSHGCLLTDAANVYGARYLCWGGNDHGELGYGELPTPAENFHHARAATALPVGRELVLGECHGCMIAGDESIVCWGRSRETGIGVGEADEEVGYDDVLEPMPVQFSPEWSAAP